MRRWVGDGGRTSWCRKACNSDHPWGDNDPSRRRIASSNNDRHCTWNGADILLLDHVIRDAALLVVVDVDVEVEVDFSSGVMSVRGDEAVTTAVEVD